MEQKITSTTQHNREHNPHMSDSTIQPCLLQGYGCNNVKLPQPPHRNTMIDVMVLGCGPIRTGKGAVAPFIGVYILGEIQPVGGFDTLAKSRWEDQIGPSILIQKINHITINRRRPVVLGKSAVGRNGGPVCGDGN